MKSTATTHFLVCFLTLQVVVKSNPPPSEHTPQDPDSQEYEQYGQEDERDEHIIKNAAKRLTARPENDKYPFVVKVGATPAPPPLPGGEEDEDPEKEKNEILLKYITPKIDLRKAFINKPEFGEGGVVKGEVFFATEYLDMGQDMVVVGMGDKGLGYSSKGTYILFRKSKNNETVKHYMNLAFVRSQMKRYSVEWSILDSSVIGRNRLELDFCRETVCDIFHHLFGTCALASHKCEQPLQGPPEIVDKFMWKAAPTPTPGPDADPNANPNVKPAQLLPVEGGQVPNLTETNVKRHAREAQGDPSLTLDESVGVTEDKDVSTREIKEPIPGPVCVKCEKIEDFFQDFEEDPEYVKLVKSTLLTLHQDVLPDLAIGYENEKLLHEHPEVPYLGFGHCSVTDWFEHSANFTQEIEDLVKFFMASMRLNCDSLAENRVRSMFTSKLKLLEIQEDFSVGVAHTSPILKYKLLTPSEFRTVVLGILMKKYIKVYRLEGKRWLISGATPTNPTPSHGDNSRSVHFITKLILEGINSFNKIFLQHFIRGHRFLLRILRDKFHMLLMSDEGAKTRLPDLHRLMALKEFILYGMGPSKKSGSGVEPAFTSFETDNHKRIRKLVTAYL